MGGGSLLIKVQVQKKLFTKNCVAQTEILLALFLSYVIFHISPRLVLLKIRFYQYLKNQHPCSILLEFCHSSPPHCKNHKKPLVDEKAQACETLTLTKGFVFFSYSCSKQSISRLLTGQNF